jgi:hypothetical protein
LFGDRYSKWLTDIRIKALHKGVRIPRQSYKYYWLSNKILLNRHENSLQVLFLGKDLISEWSWGHLKYMFLVVILGNRRMTKSTS